MEQNLASSRWKRYAKPSPRKLPISVVKDLQQAVLLDPCKKAKDLRKVSHHKSLLLYRTIYELYL